MRRSSSGRSSIIIDRDMLVTTHVPPGVTCRESQVGELSFCMSPICKGRNPINAFLYGKSGSGKTAVTRFLLAKLHQEVRGRGIYVNCWKYSTAYSMLDKMNNDMRILGEQSQSTITRISNLQRFTAGKPHIVILDEINVAPIKERNDVIYHLTEMDNVGIVCICGSDDMLYSLEDKVRSRFMPVKIHFPPYSEDELVKILTVRAEAALYPGTWNVDLLKRIASLANGDARIAIGANIHHRIIYPLIQGNPDVTSTRLMELYREKCSEMGTPPLASRTFTHYLSRMRDMGLIQEDQARERGRVRCFRIR